MLLVTNGVKQCSSFLKKQLCKKCVITYLLYNSSWHSLFSLLLRSRFHGDKDVNTDNVEK